MGRAVYKIKELFKQPVYFMDKEVVLQGWIRNHRKQKNLGFIEMYDGSCFKPIQLVYATDSEKVDYTKLLHNGAAIRVTGVVKEGYQKESIEIDVSDIELVGDCPEDYPIQPKRHTLEFLRGEAHLRVRTKLFQAVFRVRDIAAKSIHRYFDEEDFLYVHTPLITGNDAEGAGNTFTVTSKEKFDKYGKHEDDFFGIHSSLAVTGQLEAEAFAMAFGNVYTFGPSFRAENSNTKTHAAEFWMVEPEMAFCKLPDLMDREEDFLKSLLDMILKRCPDELEFLESYTKLPLRERMQEVIDSEIPRITHEEAITILKESGLKFEFEPKYGEDLAKEHEKYLTEVYFKSPVFLYDWPKDIKAFYMKQNDDGKTVAAVDLLVPGAGELMGGSERETRLDVLETRMKELGISTESLDWYLDLRRYGGCEHSGFGMGFERLLIYVTGMENIRDVIPFHRTPGSCEF